MSEKNGKHPECSVVESPKIVGDFRACRRMLVGPGVNTLDPFPGYTGFVGWESVICLRNGTWLLGFSAGYWHASPPTPLTLDPDMIREWEKIGFPSDMAAPRGGRAMICVYGRLSDHESDSECGFFRTVDRGDTWERMAAISSDHEISEGSIAQLESGRIVLVTRPEADVCWSDDGGRNRSAWECAYTSRA